jgi:DNA-binding response OmpR family regulator
MPDKPNVVALDVDRDSLTRLREAFTGWRVEALDWANGTPLTRDVDPGAADLLVVGAHERLAKTLELCRGLRGQAGRARTPLLVLLGPAQREQAGAVLQAGADSCLVLPVHPKELVSVLARVRAGNRPGRHTSGLDRAQREDPWRDDGGEA